MSVDIVGQWLDTLAVMLTTEAQLSGLLGHGTMIGDAREFLVTRVLRSFLPPSIHIGRGRVIDSEGGMSKQIDVIIYDPRFPLLGTDGGGSLYFVEGVIGAIEVKSTLDNAKLSEALDNCHSVMALSLHGSNRDEMDAFVESLEMKGMDSVRAEQSAKEQLTPRTYIFGFDSKLSLKATADAIQIWYRTKGEPVSKFQVHLPRIIASGNAVAIADDSELQAGWDEAVLADLRSQYGADSRIVMHVHKTEKQFAWLAISLMERVASRLGCRDALSGVTFNILNYLSTRSISADFREPHCVVWTGTAGGEPVEQPTAG